MRWTQETLQNARGIVFVIVGVLVLVAFVVSRL